MTRPLLPLLLLLLALPASAQDCPEPDQAKMMEVQQKMMALMAPGPEHELLQRFVGEWEGNTKIWMMAGAPPMESVLTQSWQSVLGGRFLQGTQKGNFGGFEMESIGMLGFDRRHEIYTMLGFDSMGTYYVTASGTYDAAAKTMRFSGTDDDPVGGITQVYDIEIEWVDDDTFIQRLIFHCPTYGAEGPHKLMEQTMTRKK